MSAKFNKQQKRRRWCDAGTLFPAWYLRELQQHAGAVAPAGGAAAPAAAAAAAAVPSPQAALAQHLLQFASIQFTYGEVEDLKGVVAAAEKLTNPLPLEDPSWEACSRLLLQLLFLENSKPLHRQLLSFVRKMPPAKQQAAGRLMCSMLRDKLLAVAQLAESEQTGGVGAAPAVPTTTSSSSSGLQQLVVSQAALSMTWLPAATTWLAPAAAQLLGATAASCDTTLTSASSSERPLTAQVMEAVQDGIGLLYWLLQHQGHALATAGGEEGRDAVVAAATAMLRALQGVVLVREAMASAAVVVWSAVLLPDVPPAAAAAVFAAGLLTPADSQQQQKQQQQQQMALWQQWQQRSLVEAALQRQGTCLVAELQAASAMGRLCGLKGLLTAMRLEALCADLSTPSTVGSTAGAGANTDTGADATTSSSSDSSLPLMFLVDLALPAAVCAVEVAPDAHFKFHAMGVVNVLLQQVKSTWQALQQLGPAHAAVVLGLGQTPGSSSRPGQEEGAGAANMQGDDAELAAAEVAEGALGSSSADDLAQQLAAAAKLDAVAPPISDHPAVAGVGGQRPLLAPWLPPRVRCAVLGMLWSNLDEPMAQTLKQVQESFDHLLEAVSCAHTAARQLQLQPPPGCSPADATAFLQDTAVAVLGMAPGTKGRYSPLTSLLPKVGARWLLQREPRLVQQTLAAMQDDMVANTATSFFKALLTQLRQEVNSEGGDVPVEGQSTAAGGGGAVGPVNAQSTGSTLLDAWTGWWLQPLLEVLWGADERQRTYVTSHALPAALQLEPQLLQPMVVTILQAAGRLTPGQTPVNVIAALVVVLKVARQLLLFSDLDALTTLQPAVSATAHPATGGAAAGGGGLLSGVSAVEVLMSAATSDSEALRVEALELACVNPRKSEPPGEVELSLVAAWAGCCLRCPGGGSRNKVLVLLGKLLERQKGAVAAARHRAATGYPAGTGGGGAGAAGRGAAAKATPAAAAAGSTPAAGGGGSAGPPPDPWATELAAVVRQQEFLQWLSQLLLDSLYPGSPYERKQTALDLLVLLLDTWANTPWAHGCEGTATSTTNNSPATQSGSQTAPAAGGGGRRGADTPSRSALLGPFRPLCAALLSPAAVAALLAGVVDSWDRLRGGCIRVLSLLKLPLPGLESPAALQQLLGWSGQLLLSPRVRESDAGARLLQLLFQQYTLKLGWGLSPFPLPTVTAPAHLGSSSTTPAPSKTQVAAAVLQLLQSLTGQMQAQLAVARQDLGRASQQGLVHGVLLGLRYAVELVPWSELSVVSSQIGQIDQITLEGSEVAAAAVGRPPQVAVQLQGWMQQLCGLLHEVAELAAPLLTQQDMNVAAGEVDEDLDDADLDEEDLDLEDPDAAGDEITTGSAGGGNGAAGGNVEGVPAGVGVKGPAVQLLITASWTSCKELALLVGTLARCCPLPGELGVSDEGTSLGDGSSSGTAAAAAAGGMAAAAAAAPGDGGPVEVVPAEAAEVHAPAAAAGGGGGGGPPVRLALLKVSQLSQLGSLLLQLLLSLKHNGAVEKSQAGFIALCQRLLGSSCQALSALPGTWLQTCLARLQQRGQSRDDIVRRSAGLPFAFTALFLSEPGGLPRALLPAGLQALLAVAVRGSWGAGGQGGGASASTAAAGGGGGGAVEAELVVEDAEEPWPRVHAFNVLNSTFNDASLALDSSGWHAAGLMAAIAGMAHPAWEVRNAASLTLTALMLRVIGFRNTPSSSGSQAWPQHIPAAVGASSWADGGSSSSRALGATSSSSVSRPRTCTKAPTAGDFFARYPLLHSFFLQQLTAAHQQLQATQPTQQPATPTAAPPLPPGLFPLLVVLSRLRPSLLPATAAGPRALALNPAALLPSVRACSSAGVWSVRKLAAAALVPLVPGDNLLGVCVELAQQLPEQPAVAGGCAARQLSSNALHGLLLQLQGLLGNAASSQTGTTTTTPGSSSSSSDLGAGAAVLLQQLLPHFHRGLWLASSSSCSCGPVRTAYLAAAEQLLSLGLCTLGAAGSSSSRSSVLQQHLRDYCCQLRSTCLKEVQSAASTAQVQPGFDRSTPMFDWELQPQGPQALQAAAGLLFGPLAVLQLLLESDGGQLQGREWTEGLLELLQPLLATAATSSCYEVRAAALQAVARHLEQVLALQHHQVSPGAATRVTLVTQQLWGWLGQERHHKVCKRLLRVLGLLQTLAPAAAAAAFESAPAASAAAGDGVAAVEVVQLTTLLQHVQQVTAVAGQVKETESKMHVLRCWGQALEPCLAAALAAPLGGSSHTQLDQVSSSALSAAVQSFLVYVKSFGQPWQPERLRAVAAEALQVSGLLQLLLPGVLGPTATATSSSSSGNSTLLQQELAQQAVQAWGVLLELLEDEEEQVRLQAAAAARSALQLAAPNSSSSTGSASSSTTTDNSSGSGAVQMQQMQQPHVVVQEKQVFKFLAGACSWLPGITSDVLQLLSRLVLDTDSAIVLPAILQRPAKLAPAPEASAREGGGGSAAADAASRAGGGGASGGGFLNGVNVRRLFDKEADNHYQEGLFTAQCAAAGMVEVLLRLHATSSSSSDPPGTAAVSVGGAGNSSQDVPAAAAGAVMASWVEQLGAFLQVWLGPLQQQGRGWIGGLLNHPAVFAPLYRCLLGLTVAAAGWPPAVNLLSHPQQQQQQPPPAADQQVLSAQQPQQVAVAALLQQLAALQPPLLLQPLVAHLQQLLGTTNSGSGSGSSPVLLTAGAESGAGFGAPAGSAAVGSAKTQDSGVWSSSSSSSSWSTPLHQPLAVGGADGPGVAAAAAVAGGWDGQSRLLFLT